MANCTFIALAMIIFAKTIYDADGACNTCFPTSNAACVSPTEFQICVNESVPSGPVFECPSPLVCQDDFNICVNATTSDDLGCAQTCGECGTDGNAERFACLDRVTYALCFGGNLYSAINGTCPTGEVCSQSAVSPDFCVPSTNAPTCNTLSEPTTTEPPATTTPSTLSCAQQGRGRWVVAGTGCKQYLYCYPDSSSTGWKESVYTCPGTTLFNQTAQVCGTGITCSS